MAGALSTSAPGRVSAAWTAAATVFIAGLGLWWALTGYQLGWYTVLNDFWGPFFIADHLSLSDPRSLHNGFFPIGYPLLLRAVRSSDILAIAYILSVGSAVWLLGHVLVSLRHTSAPLAAGAVVALGLHPLFFQHAVTAGPDMLAAALATSGLLFGLRNQGERMGRAVLAGSLLGLSGLLRYHGFLFAMAAVIGLLCAWPRRWRQTAATSAAVVTVGSIQVLCNIVAGVPPFRTAQAFNVYRTFRTVDWYHLQPTFPESVVAVIRLAPADFLGAYWASLVPTLPYAAPAVVAALVARGPNRRVAWAAAIASLIYLPLQALGSSPRGPLLVVPLFFVGCALVAHAIVDRMSHRTARAALQWVAVLIAVGTGLAWVGTHRRTIDGYGAIARTWAEAESELRAAGVRQPAEVFTDSFDFYFTSVRSRHTWDYRPRNTGGWARIDLHGYERAHPPLRTTSLPEFLADCERVGVTHLALTAAAGAVLADLETLQEGRELPLGLKHVATRSGIRIIALPRTIASP